LESAGWVDGLSTVFGGAVAFCLAAGVVLGACAPVHGDENDWFIYLGSRTRKKSPPKGISAAEALPPLPLPATPG